MIEIVVQNKFKRKAHMERRITITTLLGSRVTQNKMIQRHRVSRSVEPKLEITQLRYLIIKYGGRQPIYKITSSKNNIPKKQGTLSWIDSIRVISTRWWFLIQQSQRPQKTSNVVVNWKHQSYFNKMVILAFNNPILLRGISIGCLENNVVLSNICWKWLRQVFTNTITAQSKAKGNLTRLWIWVGEELRMFPYFKCGTNFYNFGRLGCSDESVLKGND